MHHAQVVNVIYQYLSTVHKHLNQIGQILVQ